MLTLIFINTYGVNWLIIHKLVKLFQQKSKVNVIFHQKIIKDNQVRVCVKFSSNDKGLVDKAGLIF